MARRKSRKKRRKRQRTRRYNKRRRKTRRRRRRSRRRGGLSMGMNTVNQQRKAIHKHTVAEAVRQKDKGSISWEKGDGKCYICVHSGSRAIGQAICGYHQLKAISNIKYTK